MPIIGLSLLQKIELVEKVSTDIKKENEELKNALELVQNNKNIMEEETKKMRVEMIKLKTTQEEIARENNNIKSSLDFALNKITTLEINDKAHQENEKKMS